MSQSKAHHEEQPRQPAERLPGADLNEAKMPGHWLLARMGKRVLRPGGRELTQQMVDDLQIDEKTDIVELAPGLGLTARLLLERKPRSYNAVERDSDAAAIVKSRLAQFSPVNIHISNAEETGLNDACTDIVLAEAMLTMNNQEHKIRIAKEAYRILRRGGQYAIHELAICPEDAAADIQAIISKSLSEAIHVGARPLTRNQWCACLEEAGFVIEKVHTAPMALLEPKRILADEGLLRTIRFLLNIIKSPEARRRVLMMRRTFRRYRPNLEGIAIIARK